MTDEELFVSYTDKMLELHRLMAAGKGDDDEADKLREEMDDLHDEIHPIPRTMAQNLSGDLYMLVDDGMYVMTLPEEKVTLSEELHESLRDQKWGRVLEILRYSLDLPKDYIALVRGRVWLEFNPNVAREFLDYAIQHRG